MVDVNDVVKKGLCIGCGLCIKNAAESSLAFNSAGELQVNLHCDNLDIDTDVIKNSCPGYKIINSSQYKCGSSTELGSIVNCYVGWSTDEAIRTRGSSGGVISSILCYALENYEIDGVFQVGVSDHDIFFNTPRLNKTKQEILECSGSRYSPSAALLGVKRLLESGIKFVFVGKPCDVAALRQYLHLNSQFKDQVVFMVSFMCAGVPSQAGSEEVLSRFGVSKSNVESFRYRGDGWPGYATAKTYDGSEHKMSYQDSWGNILGKKIHDRCKICPDGTGEMADIVCADAWYGSDGYPEFQERPGRSIVLSRTKLGDDILKAVVEKGAIELEILDLAEVHLMQPYQITRKRVVLSRILAFTLKRKIFPFFKNMRLFESSLNSSLREIISNFWGSIKRF